MDLSKERAEHIIMSIMGFFISLLYMLIIFVLLSNSRLRRKKSNQLLLNLCIGHLMTGISHFAGMWTLHHVSRFVFTGVLYANVSLVMLTIDRCIYIRWPFRYQLMNRRMHVFFMATSPVLSFLLFLQYAVSGLNKSEYGTSFIAIPFVAILATTTGLLFIPNLLVYRIARQQRADIQQSQHSSCKNDSKSKVCVKKHELRSFYICFGCACSFTLLWFAVFVVKVLEILTRTTVNYQYLAISAIVSNMNPFADAFFCVWFNKEIKYSLKNLFKARRKSERRTLEAELSITNKMVTNFKAGTQV